MGVARAASERGGELDQLLVSLEGDLWVLMAEMATAPENRHKLTAGATLVTAEMVERLEGLIDDYSGRFNPPTEFVAGETPVAASLDLARTIVRRAERSALSAVEANAPALVYLNRLSDLLWTLARWQEGRSVTTRSLER